MSHEPYEELSALAALDALDGADAEAWNNHVSTCARCRSEVEALREAAAGIALGLEPVVPPSHVRQRVMEVASSEIRAADVVPLARPAGSTLRWLSAAAILVLVALFGWSQLRLREFEDQLVSVRDQQSALASENERLTEANDKLSEQIAAIASSSTRTISLSGQEIAPAASARVFLDEPNRRAFVFFDNLPENADDKSYQLWIIRADKADPESAGVFDASPDGRARIVVENLPVNTEIKALAVTLEPEGGVPAPTGEMVLLGSEGV